MNSPNGVHIEVVVASLHPYYEYKCQLAAETIVGRGPYGDTIIIRTLQDGMLTVITYSDVVMFSVIIVQFQVAHQSV